MATHLLTTLSTEASAHPLAITLFGSLQVTRNQQPVVHFRSNKVRALLAYLLLAYPKSVARTTLTELLWAGYAPKSARINLRQALAILRNLFAPFVLVEGDYQTVRLLVDPAVVWCDALTFDELYNACQQHEHASLAQCPLCQTRLQQAIVLHTAPFLENLDEVESAPFVEWLVEQRAGYATRLAEAQAALRPVVQPRGNLPQPLTSLIGRANDLNELAVKALHPIYRCLTLIGPGGIGKTRLALALGEQLQSSFADGVWFVALAALDPATSEGENTHLHDRLATAIGATLRLTWQGALRPTEQLIEYLRTKTLLLILDNFEHLHAGVELLVTLLQAAPQIRMVVTSRHRLSLQAQLVYQVTGLSLPPENGEETLPAAQLIARYASLQLFVERAANALFSVTYDAPTLTTISALCRLLEGAPLGIELAAALLETQTPAAILYAVRSRYTALQTNLGDLPARQRSAYAVLHTAWELLSAPEAQTLARCSVFRGGFTLAAAWQIIEANRTDLELLVNKSLLHRTTTGADPGDGRYTLHELVRQFAAEQLAQQPVAVSQPIHDRHATYYLALLESWQPGMDEERAFRLAVQMELANVEAAWDWALAGELVTRLPAVVAGLAEFYDLTNAHHAAETILQRSVTQVRTRLAAPLNTPLYDPLQHLLAALLGRLGYVYVQCLGLPQQAHPVAEEALTLALALEDARLIGYNSFVRQIVAFAEYDFVYGMALGKDTLVLAQELGLVRERALALFGIGVHATHLGDYASALNTLTQAIALAQQSNDERLAQMVRVSLGVAYRVMGDFGQAIHCFEQNLPFLRQSDAQYQIAGSLLNLGVLYMILGDHASAAAYLEEGCQMLTAQGEKRLASDGLSVLSWLCVQTGENARAIAYAQQTLALAVSDGAPQVAWLVLGDAYLGLGELDNAHRAYTQDIAISQSPSLRVDRWHAQAGLAAVLLAQNAKEEALAVVNALLSEFDPEQPDSLQHPQRVLLHCYRVLATNSDPRAAAVLQQACQLVQNRAEKISNPALRTSFLTNVPVNRALGALMAAPRT